MIEKISLRYSLPLLNPYGNSTIIRLEIETNGQALMKYPLPLLNLMNNYTVVKSKSESKRPVLLSNTELLIPFKVNGILGNCRYCTCS